MIVLQAYRRVKHQRSFKTLRSGIPEFGKLHGDLIIQKHQEA